MGLGFGVAEGSRVARAVAVGGGGEVVVGPGARVLEPQAAMLMLTRSRGSRRMICIENRRASNQWETIGAFYDESECKAN